MVFVALGVEASVDVEVRTIAEPARLERPHRLHEDLAALVPDEGTHEAEAHLPPHPAPSRAPPRGRSSSRCPRTGRCAGRASLHEMGVLEVLVAQESARTDPQDPPARTPWAPRAPAPRSAVYSSARWLALLTRPATASKTRRRPVERSRALHLPEPLLLHAQVAAGPHVRRADAPVRPDHLHPSCRAPSSREHVTTVAIPRRRAISTSPADVWIRCWKCTTSGWNSSSTPRKTVSGPRLSNSPRGWRGPAVCHPVDREALELLDGARELGLVPDSRSRARIPPRDPAAASPWRCCRCRSPSRPGVGREPVTT